MSGDAHLHRIRLLSPLDLAVALGVVTAVVSHATLHVEGTDEALSVWGVVQLAWTFLVTLGCAFRAMERADAIAARLGEPYGTLVLTLSAVAIELSMIAAVMLTVAPSPTMARDTMFAVLMILLCGFTGVALLVGGIREKRTFNLESSSIYVSLIAALATFGLVLPRFTQSRPGGYMWHQMEVFVAFASLLVYLAFLWRQSTADRDDFTHEAETVGGLAVEVPSVRATILHAVGLLATLLTVVLLAEGLGQGVQHAITAIGLPEAFAGVAVGMLILAPEGFAALGAARRGQMQRSVNVLLGSALSTIGLTIPAVLLLGTFMEKPVELGLEPTEIVLLVAALFVTAVNFARGRAGFSQGMVHVTLFLAWIAVLFD